MRPRERSRDHRARLERGAAVDPSRRRAGRLGPPHDVSFGQSRGSRRASSRGFRRRPEPRTDAGMRDLTPRPAVGRRAAGDASGRVAANASRGERTRSTPCAESSRCVAAPTPLSPRAPTASRSSSSAAPEAPRPRTPPPLPWRLVAEGRKPRLLRVRRRPLDNRPQPPRDRPRARSYHRRRASHPAPSRPRDNEIEGAVSSRPLPVSSRLGARCAATRLSSFRSLTFPRGPLSAGASGRRWTRACRSTSRSSLRRR